ncbi:hypothetical protein BU14_3131s0001 [Porphyra umbilicalis]|uniref:Uncharacterized protein n=1 Tax=Porphyra umbilicalis TaxID=2786 RepID=A0A1X6NI08_PORUM|nr:hypothetical protein BU14_3131s0001 [Porphyra umbilicalis]|eukprot:OSX68254.1 hypothetical protein BU14_3131s0001 [Porphyra umbilicalis]
MDRSMFLDSRLRACAPRLGWRRPVSHLKLHRWQLLGLPLLRVRRTSAGYRLTRKARRWRRHLAVQAYCINSVATHLTALPVYHLRR